MPDHELPAKKEQMKIDEYHLLEIKEIFERIRSYSSLRVTIATFFGTINLTTLGLAFNLKNAVLFIIAAATIILWIISDTYAKRELRPFYYRGLQLEKKYAPEGEEALLHTYIDVVKSRRDLKDWLSGIAELDTQTERVKKLRAIELCFGGTWLVWILICVVELGLGIALCLIGGWF